MLLLWLPSNLGEITWQYFICFVVVKTEMEYIPNTSRDWRFCLIDFFFGIHLVN